MSSRKILKILEEHKGEILSGIDLAQELGLSRNAIWKGINTLKEEGYLIESVKNKGYRLLPESDSLSESEIRLKLQPQAPDYRFILLEEVPSTNSYLKENRENRLENNTVVLAKVQTQGRGRLGKTFHSQDKGGIYLSLYKNEHLSDYDISLLTIATALAVSDTLDQVAKVSTGIKWVNDLYLQGKKIAGILTEGTLEMETGSLSSFIIGIGINVNVDAFPEELTDIASSLSLLTRKTYSRNEIIAALLSALESYLLLTKTDPQKLLARYREKLLFVGETIDVIRGKDTFQGILTTVNDEGHLVVDCQGQRVTFNSGEISIRKAKK